MQPEHITHKKVTTRKRESSKKVHLYLIVRQYQKELRGGKLNYYSSDDISDTDSYTDSKTDSETDSGDDRLIIDDKNTENQVPDNKNTENETKDQIPGTRTPEQTPGSTADTPDQTPDNK